MSELAVFTFADQRVRTIVLDDEPWFVAKDVCAGLGIANHRDAVNRLDRDGVGTTDAIDSMGRHQQATVISEPAVYELAMTSRRPEARPFVRWLSHDVVPAIRATGAYQAPARREPTRLELIDMARDAELGRLAEAEARQAAEEHARQLQPSADAWDHLAAARGDYSLRDAAQVLTRDGIATGQNRLARTIRADLRRLQPSGAPYQWVVDRGWLTTRPRSHHHPRTGELVLDPPQIRVTVRGVAKLRQYLQTGSLLEAVGS